MKNLTKKDSTALKGLAIAILAFAHCYRKAVRFSSYNIVFWPLTDNMAICFSIYAKIGVSLFAFVSGYGLMYSYSRKATESSTSSSRWLVNRLLSMLQGYWFISIGSYLLFACLGMLKLAKWGDTISKQCLGIFSDILGISNLLGQQSLNGTWWYMSAAICFVVLLPVLAIILKKAGGTALILTVFILPRLLGFGYTGGNSVYPFLMAFVIGMVASESNVWETISDTVFRFRFGKIVRGVLLLLLVLFGIWSDSKVDRNVFWEYSFAVIPWFVILFCKDYLFRVKPVYQVLCFLGKHSMNIWLVHTFIRDKLPQLTWGLKYFLFPPLIVITLSLLISIAIEKIKDLTGYRKLFQLKSPSIS